MPPAKPTKPATRDARFEVFFDGDCPLCKKEIDMVRRMDTDHSLHLINIVDSDFDLSVTGKPLDSLMREIHGRYPDGRWITGVDVFREIYSSVGLGGVVDVSRWLVVRNLMEFGYRLFAWPRYKLAMRRLAKQEQQLPASCNGWPGNSCQQVSALPDASSISASS